MDIKESKELLVGLELVSVTIGDIAKDGIGADDIAKLLPLLSQFQSLIDAVDGIKNIPSEIKDIDQLELIELGTQAYEMIKNIIAAFKK